MQEKNKTLPLFVVAGMPRGATTFLYHYLSYHPDVFLPFRKEVNYFTVNYDRGLDWYHGLYQDIKQEKVAGDISPPCFLDPGSIKRIRSYSSDVKVILSVRDPREWAVSFYYQFKSFEKDMPSLEDYLKFGHDFTSGDKKLRIQFGGDWIVNRIKEYQDAFGDDLLIYKFDHFKQFPLQALKTIEQFLGLSEYFNETNFDNRRINESARKNINILSRILSNQTVIDTIEKTIPRKLVISLRNKFDAFSANNRGEKSKENSHTVQDIALAEAYLGEQAEAIERLFAQGPVLRGSQAYKVLEENQGS